MNENETIELLAIEPQPLMEKGNTKVDPPLLIKYILETILMILTKIINKTSGKTFKILAYIYNPLVYIYNELVAYNHNPTNYKPKDLPSNVFIAITSEEIMDGKKENDENLPTLKVILNVLISIMGTIDLFIPLIKNDKGQTIVTVYNIALNSLVDLLGNESSSAAEEVNLPTEFNMVENNE